MSTRPSGRLISTTSAHDPSPSAPISTSLKTQATYPPSVRERARKYPTAVAPPISRRSPYGRVCRLRPPTRLGLPAQDGLPRARRVCARRGRRRLLRGAHQHHRGLLVAAALLAAPAPRHLARQAAALSRLLPVRAQRAPTRQSPARSPHRRLGRMTQTQHPGTQQEPFSKRCPPVSSHGSVRFRPLLGPTDRGTGP